mgnify:CR=1 FL=1|jgi:polyphosphate kinase 2
MAKKIITKENFEGLKTKTDLKAFLKENKIKTKKVFKEIQYEEDIRKLQAELINLQLHINKNKLRVAIIFEGRDASGKGGSIKRFVEHLNPRSSRIVALNKPTLVESGQWYFRRYVKELPNPGEIVFFDRSWYNRAVVEPVMGFCNPDQYDCFMVQVPEFEHMLYESGVIVIKFWFSVAKDEQKQRFDDRLNNPLKRWKFSPVDQKGQDLWDKYSFYKEQMFSKTHTSFCPWNIVKANDKLVARLESMRFILSKFNYEGKGDSGINIIPDPNVVMRHHRRVKQLDN